MISVLDHYNVILPSLFSEVVPNDPPLPGAPRYSRPKMEELRTIVFFGKTLCGEDSSSLANRIDFLVIALVT